MRLIVLLIFSILPFCISATEVQEPDQDGLAIQKGEKASTGSAERFVMPVKTWLEERVQKSSILNPTSGKKQPKNTSKSKSSLRTAILSAQKIHPGTVLSATKVSRENDDTVFRVKILSASGVIKEIEIPEDLNGESLEQ